MSSFAGLNKYVCVGVWPKMCHELLLDGKSDDLQTCWVGAYD